MKDNLEHRSQDERQSLAESLGEAFGYEGDIDHAHARAQSSERLPDQRKSLVRTDLVFFRSTT